MNIITTQKEWDEILPKRSGQELLKVLGSCRQKKHSLSGAASQPIPCLVLLYGAARENKMAATALIAVALQQEAYRVDLLAIVSKYIGETEKNLDAVFDKAEKANWILFFDEADALFGKRTDVKDAHDKYANQEISYLFQKIEKYKNPVLIATRNKTQLPSYILRHFHSVINFPENKKS
ncbi:MAG: ATP-binding protein [Bacteroidota bacterium]